MLFYVQEREFSKSVDTDNYQFFEGDQVFVIRDWEWLEDYGDSESNQSEDDQEIDEFDASTNSTINNDEHETDEDEIPAITHSVSFKCIGSTKEPRYQEVLASANQKIRKGECTS